MEKTVALSAYLSNYKEKCPDWLANFQAGDPFNRQQFFNSRIVYYPGSGTDGHAIKVFGSSQSAHCFVYVDYLVEQAYVEAELSSPYVSRNIRGYHSLARLPLQPRDLIPGGWTKHATVRGNTFQGAMAKPYGFLEILERCAGLDQTHGASRLAILFLGADGIATYDALFCQKNGGPPPFAALIHDHGFGHNYDAFGGDSLLESIAIQCEVFPQFMLLADSTKPWKQYERCIDAAGDYGGVHNTARLLFRFTG